MFSRIACIICLCVTIFSSYQFVKASHDLTRLRATDVLARDVMINLLDAETGQRGFIITNDRSYLQPYQSGISTIPGLVRALTGLLHGTNQADAAVDIIRLTNSKLNELQKTIDLRQISFAAAAAEVDTRLGKHAMDMLRQRLDAVEAWTNSQYAISTLRSVVYGRLGFIAMFLTVVTGVMVVRAYLDNRA